jgi:hypothetical protein
LLVGLAVTYWILALGTLTRLKFQIFRSKLNIQQAHLAAVSKNVDIDIPAFPVTNTPNDFLVGFGGNDLIRGFGGQDVLIGDGLTPNEQGFDGVDTLEGGDGNDVIIGGGAGDNISGGNDDDFILGDYFLGLTNASIPINLDRTSLAIADLSVA